MFRSQDTDGDERKRRFGEKSEKWTKRAPGRRRRRERNSEGGKERILSWDRFVGWIGGWLGEWGGGLLLLAVSPSRGKSAGVRTEMLRDRVGRGCPLTT